VRGSQRQPETEEMLLSVEPDSAPVVAARTEHAEGSPSPSPLRAPLAEVRHEKGQKAANSFRISLGDC
jgi:hypothetical protein